MCWIASIAAAVGPAPTQFRCSWVGVLRRGYCVGNHPILKGFFQDIDVDIVEHKSDDFSNNFTPPVFMYKAEQDGIKVLVEKVPDEGVLLGRPL